MNGPPEGTRECFNCGEWVRMQASACPVCGGPLAALAGPAWPSEWIRWSGDVMVVPHGTRLPPTRCLFCGGHDHIMAWTTEYAWSRLTLPRCEPCRDREASARIGGVLSGFGAVVVLPAVLGFAAKASMGTAYYGAMAGLAAGLILVMVIRSRLRIVRCIRVDASGVHLRVPDTRVTREALAGMARPPGSTC